MRRIFAGPPGRAHVVNPQLLQHLEGEDRQVQHTVSTLNRPSHSSLVTPKRDSFHGLRLAAELPDQPWE